MKYCEICRTLCPDGVCETNKKHVLRDVMPTDFVQLSSREAMWAEMLLDALKDSDIPAVLMPHSTRLPLSILFGYGVEVSAVCVPYDRLDDARAVEAALFDANAEAEDAE